MKIPKLLQFRLTTIFVALTLFGIALGVYRLYLFIDDRIHHHSQLQNNAKTRMLTEDGSIRVFQESREALLAGDEDRLEDLRRRFRYGQPEEIAYVPVQLAALDKALSHSQAEYTHEENVKNYHAQMIAEYENSRWRPWRRVAELADPPKSR